MNACHICCQPLNGDESLYHAKCSSRLFGSRSPPALQYGWKEINHLATQFVKRRIAVPGVQPKLSLHLERPNKSEGGRLTLVGLEGEFILKPPTKEYPDMPEMEHYTMILAQAAGLEVASCGLTPLASGERTYIARRMDRTKTGPLHMEDMAQLTDKLTEQKYRGSIEQVGRAVLRFTTNFGFDALRLFELTLFCFLTGNADMHLKNFSLLYEASGAIRLSPAYDLLPTKLFLPEDVEEMALTVNGKKSRLHREDFDTFARSLKLTDRQIANTHNRLRKNLTKALKETPQPFLRATRRKALAQLIQERTTQLWGS